MKGRRLILIKTIACGIEIECFDKYTASYIRTWLIEEIKRYYRIHSKSLISYRMNMYYSYLKKVNEDSIRRNTEIILDYSEGSIDNIIQGNSSILFIIDFKKLFDYDKFIAIEFKNKINIFISSLSDFDYLIGEVYYSDNKIEFRDYKLINSSGNSIISKLMFTYKMPPPF